MTVQQLKNEFECVFSFLFRECDEGLEKLFCYDDGGESNYKFLTYVRQSFLLFLDKNKDDLCNDLLLTDLEITEKRKKYVDLLKFFIVDGLLSSAEYVFDKNNKIKVNKLLLSYILYSDNTIANYISSYGHKDYAEMFGFAANCIRTAIIINERK